MLLVILFLNFEIMSEKRKYILIDPVDKKRKRVGDKLMKYNKKSEKIPKEIIIFSKINQKDTKWQNFKNPLLI